MAGTVLGSGAARQDGGGDRDRAGGGAALPGQPVGAMAKLGARTVRIRIMLGGRPAPDVGGGHRGRAAEDPLPPRRACEHCHAIPYEKGVCCSNLGVRVQCAKCYSWVWPQEKWACCGDGKRVLENRYNPPLDEGYKALLKWPHVSYNSRLLNSALALGSQGTFPSREQGGLGMYKQGLPFLHLMGKSYLVFRSPSEGCNPFDCYLLPRQVLFDGASGDYGEQLAAFRDFSFSTTPLPGACIWPRTCKGSVLAVAQGALSMCAMCTVVHCAQGGTVHVRRVHCPCAQGALSMCARRVHCLCAQGGTVHVRRVHCLCARAGTREAPSMCTGGHCLCAQGALCRTPLHPHSPPPRSPLLTTQPQAYAQGG